MAANGGNQTVGPILSALSTLQANVDRAQKAQAHEYLEKFQKAQEAWTATFTILQTPESGVEAKLFAATTLKGKITYDLQQLPRSTLTNLRQSLLSLLSSFSGGPKPIRTQLCVCLANLAIQMIEWKDVIPLLLSTLGTGPRSIPCILEFLHVLPEEVTEGRKINLSEDELHNRTIELLSENAQQVLQLLIEYSQSSEAAARDPQLFECITSWLNELPLADVIGSPLLKTIVDGLSDEVAFDAAIECFSAIFRETREVDEYEESIRKVFPHIISQRGKIAVAAEDQDTETLKGLTRLFSEASEAWVVLICRRPETFRPLVETVLECAARDKDRDVVNLTFPFWYELKQYLILETYIEARVNLADLISKLVDVMIKHLEWPKPNGNNETDLFEGDRSQEEKFREFRHQMGDVLKDCCEIIGVTECLKKPYELIEAWVQNNASHATNGQIPNWQALEAPLFSMRAMGRMVPPDENIMLPRLIPLIIQIPDHEKVKFQAVMAIGRYTEWTAHHADTLHPQLNFIMAAFLHPSAEVVGAAALSFKFFCNDCAELLKNHIEQIEHFYKEVLDRLPASSQDDVTEGVASIVAKQPLDKLYQHFKASCDPILNKLMAIAQSANEDKAVLERRLADQLQLLTIFVHWIQPFVDPSQHNPAVQYCQEIFPVTARLADLYPTSIPILERTCRLWRRMLLSYRSGMAPMLPAIAEKLVAGFAASRQGCFLWASNALVREFSEGAEGVDPSTSVAVFQFYEQQTLTFLRALSNLTPEELPDVIDDFYRLSSDVLLYYPDSAVVSEYMKPVIEAANSALTLMKEEPLLATLRFFRDFLAYGGEYPPASTFDAATNSFKRNLPETQAAVKQLLSAEGESMTQRLMTGMMYSFPRDCFPDASGVLLGLFQIMPEQTSGWVKTTITLLPPGSITPQESQRLMSSIEQRIHGGDIRKVRTILQDFTNSYRRRHVAPREGLGRLEATKFRFNQ